MASDQQKIKAALAKMRVGEVRNVRVGPGRKGLVTVKKGKSDSGKLLSGVGTGERRAKVVSSRRKKR